jgi:Cu2+-exporting ATPase
MKTSVIKVGDMLSVWSLNEVESRIGEVPGVESVTVNFAAESATVRYDETRVAVTDIKSTVHELGLQRAKLAKDVPVAEDAPFDPHKPTFPKWPAV